MIHVVALFSGKLGRAGREKSLNVVLFEIVASGPGRPRKVHWPDKSALG
jgi:hypothetical protein